MEEKHYFHFKGAENDLEEFKREFPQYKIFGAFANNEFTMSGISEWYADIPLDDPIVPTLKKAMLENMLKKVMVERHREIIKYLSEKFDTLVIEDWNDSATNPSSVYRPVFENAALYIYDYIEEVTLKMYDEDGDEEYYKLNTPNLEKILEERIKKAVIKINAQ